MQMFTPHGENRVFKFDKSEAVYFKSSVEYVIVGKNAAVLN